MLPSFTDGAVVAVMVMVMMRSTYSIVAPGTGPALDTTDAPQPNSIFQRVDVISLHQLVVLGGVVEPYSCWCDHPGASCPVRIPGLPLHQVLNVTCGEMNLHCCQERGAELSQQHSPLTTSHNITTVHELSNLLDYIIDTLKPYKNRTLMESKTTEGEVLPEIKNDLIIDDQDLTKERLHNPGMKRPAHILENGLLVALKDVAEYLLTLAARPRSMDTPRSNTNVHSLQRRGIQEFNTQSEYYSEAGVKESLSVDVKTEQFAGLYNVSNDIIEKVDFALPYGSLGWFSKAVELAIDGSLYVGIALAVMFFAATLLTGGMTFIGDTCFICSIIGYVNVVSIT